MLTKLRLFVKEFMNAIISGIGGIIIGFAFYCFVEANKIEATNPHLFLWLSILLFIIAVSCWTIAIVRQWREEKKREKRENEREKRENERWQEEKALHQLEVEKLEREKPYPGPGTL